MAECPLSGSRDLGAVILCLANLHAILQPGAPELEGRGFTLAHLESLARYWRQRAEDLETSRRVWNARELFAAAATTHEGG